jgi:hypothetical protein
MHVTPSAHRTNLDEFLWDLLAFIEEKINEALNDPESQFAAITEAGGAIPVMRSRLTESNYRWTTFVLVLGTKIERDYWQDWWHTFAKMDRAVFLPEATALAGPEGAISVLRSVLSLDETKA